MLTRHCKKDFIKHTGEKRAVINSFLRLDIGMQWKIFKEYFEGKGYEIKIEEDKVREDVLYIPKIKSPTDANYTQLKIREQLRPVWFDIVTRLNMAENKRLKG